MVESEQSSGVENSEAPSQKVPEQAVRERPRALLFALVIALGAWLVYQNP